MLVVGIDLGTQSLKAVVCDAQLVIRGQHAVPVTTAYPRPGHAEQDAGAWDGLLAPAIAGALAAAKASPADITAIAIAGQLDGCIAVDEQGTAIHPALIWQDRRAVAEAARIDAARVQAVAGQVADPSHLGPKAAWLLGAGHRAHTFHQPVSYLVQRLTGERVLDPAHASTTMLYDLRAGAWSAELLAALGIDERQLPVIQPATAAAGVLSASGARLTGLAAGTPVAVGTGDDFATPLGAGVTTPGASPIAVVLGTAEVVGALDGQCTVDTHARPMLETHAYPSGGFFIENPGWLSGGAVRWATELFGLASGAELDRVAATAPVGAEGLVFVPALTGAMTPVWQPHARGTLHGLAPTHGPGHIARAVLEGLAFACRSVLDRIVELEVACDRVLLLGGGSRSELWAQIRADVTGLPHAIAAHADTCAVGAAMIAAVAGGLAPDLVTAATALPPPLRVVEPDAERRDAYRARYAQYARLVTQVAPLGDSPW